MDDCVTDREILEWLIHNVRGNMVPAQDFEKFLTSIGLDYENTIENFSNNGIIYKGSDGYLHLRALPVTKPRIHLSIGETTQTEPYNFVKRAATIERDIALTENPVEALKGLQNLLKTFMESTPTKSAKVPPLPDQRQITSKPSTQQEQKKEDSQKPTLTNEELSEVQKGLESLEWKPSPTKSYRYWIHTSDVPPEILAKLKSTTYLKLGSFSYRFENDFIGRYERA